MLICQWSSCCDDTARFRYSIPDVDGSITFRFCSLDHMIAHLVKQKLKGEYITLSSLGEKKIESALKDVFKLLSLTNGG